MLPFNFKNRLSSLTKGLVVTYERNQVKERLQQPSMLAPAKKLTKSSILLSADLFDQIMDDGFYGLEKAEGTYFRWTRGHASLDITIPHNFRPNRLVINFFYINPKGSKLKIVYNKHLIESAYITPGVSSHVFKIPMSAYDTNKTNAHIEIFSDVFLPSIEHDRRILGVAISNVELYQTKVRKFLDYFLTRLYARGIKKRAKKANFITTSLLHLQALLLRNLLPSLNKVETLSHMLLEKKASEESKVQAMSEQLSALEKSHLQLQKQLSSINNELVKLQDNITKNFRGQSDSVKKTDQRLSSLKKV